MRLEVTVQVGGADTLVGTLYTHARRGVESASFAYDSSYLDDPGAFAISPDLPLVAGTQRTQGAKMFSAIADAMPDRWGRNLLARAESWRAHDEGRTARTLMEADYLVGVNDETRQGALRFWDGDVAVARPRHGVPREVSVPQLLRESISAEDDAMADVRDLLLDAGSSLGGARPKASVRDERGVLMIAKFPKSSEGVAEDVCAWEHVALLLAARAGIVTPPSRQLRVDGRTVLLLERFDRRGGERVPYMSGLAAVQGCDGGSYSYLELVEFLEENGSDPDADIPQLWRRVLYSCLVGNTDDHMRNHGFLWDGRGWRLSPAFDVNPTPGGGEKYLSCAVDFDDRTASTENALSACEYYRVGPATAREELVRMRLALADWERAAHRCGISAPAVERMRTCFERARSC